MAVAKVSLLEPLEKITFDVKPCTLILGGGVAGMESARNISKLGQEVYLIENLPTLGGNTARIGKLFYTEKRGAEVTKQLANSLNGNVHVFTNSELEKLDGSVGGFKAKIKIYPRYVNEKCNLCGKCKDVCPIEVPNEYEFKLDNRKAIYIPFPEAQPNLYVIDPKACTKCGKCVEVCEPKAIDLEDKLNEIDIRIGSIIVASGYQPYDPAIGEYGFEKSNRVITLLQLNRLLDINGPTDGKLLINGEIPKNIVFILCVGSLNSTPNAKPYCSRVCCSSSLQKILEMKEQYPDTTIFVLYKSMRTYGRMEETLYENVSEKGIPFILFEDSPKVDINKEKIDITVYDELIQENLKITPDLVVLANGMNPSREIDKLRQIVKVGCSPEGFIREAHLKLKPIEAPASGIFLSGTVTGPKNVIESITSGGAAASKAAALSSKSHIEAEPMVAVVNEDLCSGCGICIPMCPYSAITQKEEKGRKIASVDKALCQDCGTCSGACPSGAMQQAGFKDNQIDAQVISCFKEVD
jgi:heterodisulfide reductase subunit A